MSLEMPSSTLERQLGRNSGSDSGKEGAVRPRCLSPLRSPLAAVQYRPGPWSGLHTRIVGKFSVVTRSWAVNRVDATEVAR